MPTGGRRVEVSVTWSTARLAGSGAPDPDAAVTLTTWGKPEADGLRTDVQHGPGGPAEISAAAGATTRLVIRATPQITPETWRGLYGLRCTVRGQPRTVHELADVDGRRRWWRLTLGPAR